MADKLMWFKYIVKNVARKHGKTATFMPKPLFGDNGSACTATSRSGRRASPLRRRRLRGPLADSALYYIGGILKHAKSLAAFTNPTTNSYRRLVPGFEAPVNLAYSSRNRSASIRIPITGPSPEDAAHRGPLPRPELQPVPRVRAMLLAGLDGIQNKIDPGDPLDKDIYALSPEELKDVPHMPGSLEEALDALERDHEFLLRGDVFTKDAIQSGSTTSATQGAQPDPPAPDAARVLPLLRHLTRRST